MIGRPPRRRITPIAITSATPGAPQNYQGPQKRKDMRKEFLRQGTALMEPAHPAAPRRPTVAMPKPRPQVRPGPTPMAKPTPSRAVPMPKPTGRRRRIPVKG